MTNTEFVEPAILFLTRTANLSHLVAGYAPVFGQQRAVDTSTPRQQMAPPAHFERPPPARQVPDAPSNHKKRKAGNAHVLDSEGNYKCNRQGTPLCTEFQTGACGGMVGQNRCPKDREKVHQCARCLGVGHGVHRCYHDTTPMVGAANRTGKGKVKGKKGKGGRHW